MQSIGLIGLGNAGRPMAERILAGGFSLTVYDLDGAAVDAAVACGAIRAGSAAEAVCDITITLCPRRSKCAKRCSANMAQLTLCKRGGR